MTRVLFMGTPEFSVQPLRALNDAFEVVGVYSQPDRPSGRGKKLKLTPIKLAAQELGLSVFQPERVSSDQDYENIRNLKPDFIVVSAFGQILKQELLDIPKFETLNIHTSLLPRWRGAAPIQRAILAGDRETGVTIMKVVRKLDAGDIISQVKIPIESRDTAGSIHDKLSDLGAREVVSVIRQIEQGSALYKPQEESLVTYAEKLSKELQWLNPEHSAEELDRQVRALHPWPGTSLRTSAGERIKIIETRVSPKEAPQLKGRIGELDKCLYLGTAKGLLELTQVQREGKKPQSATEFLNAWKGQSKELPFEVVSG